MSLTLTLRPPSHLTSSTPTSFTPPSLTFLSGTWHITHSTLPMWASKRNVRITYTPLPPPPSSTTNTHPPSTPVSQIQKLDDLVEYQSLSSDKTKTVHGIDTPSGTDAGAWDWRGKGWLMVASSHWEVLGWGRYDSEGGGVDAAGNGDGEGRDGERGEWMLTYFASTLFTPAGIDIYSRSRNGVPSDILNGIKAALERIDDASIKKLAGEIFEIKHD